MPVKKLGIYSSKCACKGQSADDEAPVLLHLRNHWIAFQIQTFEVGYLGEHIQNFDIIYFVALQVNGLQVRA